MARIEKHLEITPTYIDMYDDELCEICGDTDNLPHRHLVEYYVPECEVCREPMKNTSTIEGKRSYSCMTSGCTNLSRYSAEGERLGNRSS